jgi:hypothetical protein
MMSLAQLFGVIRELDTLLDGEMGRWGDGERVEVKYKKGFSRRICYQESL